MPLQTHLKFLIILVMTSTGRGQDSAQDKIGTHAKLLALKKQVVAAGESQRLEAVKELAEVADDEPTPIPPSLSILP